MFSNPEFNSPASARANGVSMTNAQSQKKGESSTSGRGVIPKARIKTIKMTLVIVLGMHLLKYRLIYKHMLFIIGFLCPFIHKYSFSVFILCWSPFFVFDLLDVYGHIPMSQEKVSIDPIINFKSICMHSIAL